MSFIAAFAYSVPRFADPRFHTIINPQPPNKNVVVRRTPLLEFDKPQIEQMFCFSPQRLQKRAEMSLDYLSVLGIFAGVG
jgi:hypothetical protein